TSRIDDPVGLLRRMRVPRGPAVAGGAVWSAEPTGFASVPTPSQPHGARGGLGGTVHVVRTAEELTMALAAEAPRIILVKGTITTASAPTARTTSGSTTASSRG